MTMFISGVASVPMEYITDAGYNVFMTQDNMAQLVADARGTNFVMNHVEYSVSDVRGALVHGALTDDGRFYYEALVNDWECESEIERISATGKVPNVSIMAIPTEDADITIDEERSTDDKLVYQASAWKLLHLSLVSRGECSDKDGCGIFDYKLLNSAVKTPLCPKLKVAGNGSKNMPTDDGINTPDAVLAVLNDRNNELSDMKVQLSAADAKNTQMENELAELRAFKAQQEANAETARVAEADALKTQILQIAPDAQLDGITDVAGLRVALSAYKNSTKPRGQFNARGAQGTETDEMSPSKLALVNAYKARQEKFIGNVGMRKETKERFGIKE